MNDKPPAKDEDVHAKADYELALDVYKLAGVEYVHAKAVYELADAEYERAGAAYDQVLIDYARRRNMLKEQEIIPECDICHKSQYICVDPSCGICASNWNGETGIHRTCEYYAE